jgi:hypothetical protein
MGKRFSYSVVTDPNGTNFKAKASNIVRGVLWRVVVLGYIGYRVPGLVRCL